jgi:hypothetical protein
MAPQHRLHREQSQNPERYGSNPQIADGDPRQDSQHRVGDQSCRKAIHTQFPGKPTARDFANAPATWLRPQLSSAPRLIPRAANFWCTGEDSNLRTSLGGTDLQSVGFNHSPTCAKAFRRCGRRVAPADRAIPSADTQKRLLMKRSQSQVNFAKQGNQGRAQRQSRRSLHAGKVPNGVRWKNLLRHYKPTPPPDGKLVPSFILWSWRRDSNPRPSDYKSDALPTELRQQFRGQLRLRANQSL